MARYTLPMSGPAATDTIEDHLRIGRRWLAQAMADHPDCLPEEALVLAQRQAGPLDPSSVGRYRADLRYTLEDEMKRSGRGADFAPAWKRLNDVLSERSTKIAPEDRRTSALKNEDATESEVKALFYELKRHGLQSKNPNTILAALFVLVAGHTGFRPIELRGASFDGTRLTLPNAKKRPGHPPTREQDLSALDSSVLKGVALLIALIDHDLTKREFIKWQKCLAGQLQRACERIDIRTLSLYSFRHVAIASWAAAGLSPEEIALLCGHLSIRTAHAHYARSNVGHKRSAVARAVQAQRHPEAEPSLAEAKNPTSGTQDKAEETKPLVSAAFVVEEVPVAVLKGVARPPALTEAEVRLAFDRQADPRPVGDIVSSLRQARIRAEVELAPEPNSPGESGD